MTSNRLWKIQLIVAFLFCFLVGQAQNSTEGFRSSKGKYLGKSSPMTTWNQSALDNSATYTKLKVWKNSVNGIPNFKGKKNPPRDFSASILPKGGDPIVQGEINKSVVDEITILQDYDGIDYNDAGIWPPDCNGDVGLNYYLMTTNGGDGTIVHVYDKITGELVEETTMAPLWEELGAFGAGDPIIFFDRFTDRWFLTEFTSNNSMLIAVSETLDPMGAYYAYEFVAPTFPDYPHYGSWSDAIYITSNEYNGTPGYNPVYALDREAMIAGETDVTFIEFDAVTKFGDGNFFQVSSPLDFSGTMMPPATTDFMSIRIADDEWPGVDQDMIEYYTFKPDFDEPINSSFEGPFPLITEPFESNLCGFGLFDCLEQSDGTLLSAIHTVIMNKVQYRNFGDYESITLNFSVDVSGNNNAGIRWFELRKTDETPWEIYQESTFAPDDGISRFMATLSQDSKGNILMGYAMVGPDTDPSVGVTGRRVSDDPGMMTFTETVLVEGEQPSPVSRWGDYFSVTVDPQDDATFWLTSEYMPSDQDWSTRLTAMSIRRDTIDAQVSQLISPISSTGQTATEEVKMVVTNPGYEAIVDVPWGVMFEGAIIETGVINQVIEPLESVEVTLTNTVDMSAFGSYAFKAYTYMDGDYNVGNDTLRTALSNVAASDLAAGAADNISSTCSEIIDISAEFANKGFDVVTDFKANLYVNNVLVETLDITANMVQNGKEIVLFTGVVLEPGINVIRYVATEINGEADQVTNNDSYEYEVELLIDVINVNLSFKSDAYSNETSWRIEDSNGTVVHSGSGYTGFEANENIDLCFAEGCYTFILVDTYGDGWSEGNGDEFLEMTQDDGIKVVLLENFDFGSVWTQDFCLPSTCEIEVEVEYEDASGVGVDDAAIYINIIGLAEGAMYSIDGGVTFQSSPLFTNLVDGQYDIVVQDLLGCTYETSLNVAVDIEDFEASIFFTVTPNPTDGMIQLLLQGYDGPQQLDVVIVNQLGQEVSKQTINKFSDGYRAILLVPYLPSGSYYVTIASNDMNMMKKIIKR